MLEECILTLVGEVKRVADRLEMIHNHLARMPESDKGLDAKLIKEEAEAESPKSTKSSLPVGQTAIPKSTKSQSPSKKPEPKAEELEPEIEEADDDVDGVDDLFEEEAADTGEMSSEELADKCKKLLEGGKDKEARGKIRGLFVEVLKNGFGKEKTSELKPTERKNFYATFEKRVKGK
jgi:hypothetical protein